MNDIYSQKNIKEILDRNGIAPLKQLGQNFLCDRNVVEKIAAAAVMAGENVIEIGPGLGALTRAVASRAHKVVAVEIDAGMVRALDETLSDLDNVTVIHNDILKTDIPSLIEDHFGGGPVAFVGNLPYYITSKCLLLVPESGAMVTRYTAMVQKEVAERLSAKPGGKDYGAITASLAYYGGAHRLFDVGADCFMPRPDVDSAIIQFEPKAVFDVDRDKYSRVVRGLFAMRRKTVMNNAKSAFALEGSAAQALFESVGISPAARAETLSPEDFARIATALK